MPRREAELGTLLVDTGLISVPQLREALEEQSHTYQRLGEILRRRELITADDLACALSRQLGYPRYDPSRDQPEAPALRLVPRELSRRHHILPLRVEDGALVVALADPLDVEALDLLGRIAGRSGLRVQILLATAEVVEEACRDSYGREEGARDVRRLIDRIVDESCGALEVKNEPDAGEVRVRAQDAGITDASIVDAGTADAGVVDAGIVRLVDQILGQALREKATDIHVEPQESGLAIRFRVDGLLHEALSPPRAVCAGLISRIKILSNLDIAERRSPQDGRFTYRAADSTVDVRVSSIPTIHGEKLVLRLLSRSGFDFSLRGIGYSEADCKAFRNALRHSHGMVLLSGPTGSGKTTTLYAGLLELQSPAINITTVEDPVEYRIPGINQVQINERKRLVFAHVLRSFLRQDPDVIMVGEIRDRETAEVAVRAALTGHMVLSTIHANDAPSTATRLASMGVESFMAASALTLVAAQRLIRRNCRHCLVEYEPDPEALRRLGFDTGTSPPAGARSVRGAGCAACQGRGYSGRTAIVEMMPISGRLCALAAGNVPAAEIRRAAVEEGMSSLRQSGLRKAWEGLTTVEEILRVCFGDE